MPSAPVAVVLAAGLGVRLRTVEAGGPKGLVAVGDGPIIARSVDLLRAAGVVEFVFVVGWRAEAYRAWAANGCPGARFVDNPDYATTGSLRSLLLGAAAVPGRDVLVVESDLLYETRAATGLLAARGADTLLVSGFTRSHDEVWVYPDAAGNLRRLTKVREQGADAHGELVGLTRLAAASVSALHVAAKALPPAAHYEDGLNAIAGARPIALLKVPDLVWCEIDDAAHLARAREMIWPRLAAQRGAKVA